MTGSDDLSRSAPTDPRRLHPDWDASKRRILDDIVASEAPTRRQPGRWLATAAAAAVLIATIGIAAGVLNGRDSGQAVPEVAPSSQSTTVEALESAPSVTPPQGSQTPLEETPGSAPAVAAPTAIASGVLFDRDGTPALCAGVILESLPPQCGGDLVPLSGLGWEEVTWYQKQGDSTWAGAVLVGTDDGTTFHVQDAFEIGDPAAPHPSRPSSEPHRFDPLCETPTVGTGSGGGPDAMEDAARALPGYAGLWMSPDQVTVNLAFVSGADEAREALTDAVAGPFCVGQIEGLTQTEASAALDAIRALPTEVGIQGYGSSLGNAGSGIQADLVRVTPEIRASIVAAVGEKAAEFLTLWPTIQPYTD